MLRDPSLIPLSHQHQHGLALAVLIERGLKADPSSTKAAELCGKVADMFELELVHHFEVEEQVLFPAVRGRLASDAIVDRLIAQHREMESLAGRLAESPESGRIPLLTEFGELLSRHIRIEERPAFSRGPGESGTARLEQIGSGDRQPVAEGLPVEREVALGQGGRLGGCSCHGPTPPTGRFAARGGWAASRTLAH